METLGEVLRRARLNKKLQAKDLASILGISKSYVSRIENGPVEIEMGRLRDYCDALGLERTIIFELYKKIFLERKNAEFDRKVQRALRK